MSDELRACIRLIVEKKLREVDITDGRALEGSDEHIADLEMRINALLPWREKYRRSNSSKIRVRYSDLIKDLKGQLISAKRVAARRNAAAENYHEGATSDVQGVLKEYVHLVLTEDAGMSADATAAGITAADVADASRGGGGGAHGGTGGPKGLYDTFISPFLDVPKTALGKGQEVIRKSLTPVNVAIHTILTSIIPGLSHSYRATFDEEERDIQKIRSKYKDVYARTDKALSSNDAAFFAFLSSPAKAMSGYALTKSPEAVMGTLSALTGGYSDKIIRGELTKKFPDMGGAIDRYLERALRESSMSSRGLLPLLTEDEDDKQDEEIGKFLKELLGDEKFMEKMLTTGEAKSKIQNIQKDVEEIYRGTLEEIKNKADAALSAANFDDLKKALGDEFKEVEESLKKEIESSKEEGKDPKEVLEFAKKEVLTKTKKALKNMYIHSLEKRIEQIEDLGVPKESQYLIDYKRLVKYISSL